jgi:uncharacterized protein (DUF302 family)
VLKQAEEPGMEPPIQRLDNGVVTHASPYSFDETLTIVEQTLAARRIKIFARIDHSGEAARVGMSMRPTQLLIVGNPATGTPIMTAAPTAALDLPIRLLVAVDAAGQTLVSFDAAEYLEARHGFGSDLGQHLAMAGKVVVEALRSDPAHR